jgi:hypothetical protein
MHDAYISEAEDLNDMGSSPEDAGNINNIIVEVPLPSPLDCVRSQAGIL